MGQEGLMRCTAWVAHLGVEDDASNPTYSVWVAFSEGHTVSEGKLICWGCGIERQSSEGGSGPVVMRS